jgi:hypothetical protein
VDTNDDALASAAGIAASDLIRASTSVFKGEIKRTQAATLDLVRVNDNTVVVCGLQRPGMIKRQFDADLVNLKDLMESHAL